MALNIEAMVYLKIGKKRLPLLSKSLGDIVPDSLNTSVVDASETEDKNSALDSCLINLPSPDIGSATQSLVILHPGRNPDIFSAVISTDSTRHSMHSSAIWK